MTLDDSERLAEAVSDGTPVDWDGERRAGHTPARVVEGMRLIERLAKASQPYWSTGPGAESTQPITRPPTTPVAPTTPLSGTWGPLRLIERLGEGSFGEVYRAHDPTLQTDVALKLLKRGAHEDPSSEERFLDEARALARVRHPNVLVVHGADRHDGRIGIWTDLVRGETLEAQLAGRGTLGAREAALVGIELCHALAAVHAQGVVHRDIKASNVMRETGGRILLMDFGTVTRVTEDPDVDSRVYGTPLAMAPEQLRGGPLGPPADLYSLGVMLYQLVSGRFPIEARSIAELFRAHAAGARVPLRDRRPDLPAEFVTVVERCLEQDPAKRFASAGALERALAGSVGLPTSAPGERPRADAEWRSGLLAPAVVAALLLVVWIATRPPMPATRPSETPAAAKTLMASATIYRVSAEGREALAPGARIALGTRLAVEFESAESTWVYVLNEDDEGRAYLLFPVPGLDPVNPVLPGGPRELPGRLAGQPITWQVSSAGENEHILVVASRRPLAELDRQLAAIPAARAGHAVEYPRVNAMAMGELRGIGQLADDPDTTSTHIIARISRMLASGDQASSPRRDVWMWQTVLANPARH